MLLDKSTVFTFWKLLCSCNPTYKKSTRKKNAVKAEKSRKTITFQGLAKQSTWSILLVATSIDTRGDSSHCVRKIYRIMSSKILSWRRSKVTFWVRKSKKKLSKIATSDINLRTAYRIAAKIIERQFRRSKQMTQEKLYLFWKYFWNRNTCSSRTRIDRYVYMYFIFHIYYILVIL